MRILPSVDPTPEQLAILAESRPGVVLIKGAAGSGKTTTALLRLNHLSHLWLNHNRREGISTPVRVLVLTYNRTLEGYIRALAVGQVPNDLSLELEISTFGRWARSLLGPVSLIDPEDARRRLRRFASSLPGDTEFLVDEAEYVLSRFLPDELKDYLTTRREARGTSPRMPRELRQRLLAEVISPYLDFKTTNRLMDWNDVALEVIGRTAIKLYDVVIVDEAQDFSANQVRAIMTRLADVHSLTFVIDSAQRIYPRFFTWREAGITSFTRVYSLKTNHRNTHQIAAFARGIVRDLTVDDDGALPDLFSSQKSGDTPVLVPGRYDEQVAVALKHVRAIDLKTESVVFLKPKGGNWFNRLRAALRASHIEFVELTRSSTWPAGSESVALSTLHSAKGLEFDHVIILGLNQQVTPHGHEPGDANLESLQRLLAMGVGRARKTVMIGYKPSDESSLISILDPSTFVIETP